MLIRWASPAPAVLAGLCLLFGGESAPLFSFSVMLTLRIGVANAVPIRVITLPSILGGAHAPISSVLDIVSSPTSSPLLSGASVPPSSLVSFSDDGSPASGESLSLRDNFLFLNPAICPSLNTKVLQTLDYTGSPTIPFLISCGIDHVGGKLLPQPIPISGGGINACINYCAGDPGCFAVSFSEGPVSSGHGDCYLKGKVTRGMEVVNTRIIAAVRSELGTQADGWFTENGGIEFWPAKDVREHESAVTFSSWSTTAAAATLTTADFYATAPTNSSIYGTVTEEELRSGTGLQPAVDSLGDTISSSVRTVEYITADFYPTAPLSSSNIYGMSTNETPGAGAPIPATTALSTTVGTDLPPVVDSLRFIISSLVESSFSVEGSFSLDTTSLAVTLSSEVTTCTTDFYPTAPPISTSIYGTATDDERGTGTPVPATLTLPNTAATRVLPAVDSLGAVIETARATSTKMVALSLMMGWPSEPTLSLELTSSSTVIQSSELNFSVPSTKERARSSVHTDTIASTEISPSLWPISLAPFASSPELSSGTVSPTLSPTRPALMRPSAPYRNSTKHQSTLNGYPMGTSSSPSHDLTSSGLRFGHATRVILHSSLASTATLSSSGKVVTKTVATYKYHSTKSHGAHVVTPTSTAKNSPIESSSTTPSLATSSHSRHTKPSSKTVQTPKNSHAKSSQLMLHHAHKTFWGAHSIAHSPVVFSSPSVPLAISPYTAGPSITVTESYFVSLEITDTVSLLKGTTTVEVGVAKANVTTAVYSFGPRVQIVTGPTGTRVETHYGTRTKTVSVPGATMVTTDYSFGPLVETKTMYGPVEVTVTFRGPAPTVVAAEKQPDVPHAAKPNAPSAVKPNFPASAILPPYVPIGIKPPADDKPQIPSFVVPLLIATIKISAPRPTSTNVAPGVPSATTTTIRVLAPSVTAELAPEVHLVSTTIAAEPAPEASSTDEPGYTASHITTPNITMPAATIHHTAAATSSTTLTTISPSAFTGVVPCSSSSSIYKPKETAYNYVYNVGVTLKSTSWATVTLAITAGLWSVF